MYLLNLPTVWINLYLKNYKLKKLFETFSQLKQPLNHLKSIMEITQPTLFIDEQKCRLNIRKLVQKAEEEHLRLRPHFKTHQSHKVGRWFREEGVRQITVSSVKMATYFAQDQWDDITIAFPVNILEIKQINHLASTINLNILVESLESIEALNQQLTHGVGVFIKIDVGTHRTGIAPDNYQLLDQLLEAIKRSRYLALKGFLGHAGHSYNARNIDQIQKIHDDSVQLMKQLKGRYQAVWPNLQLSVGDTPTCSQASNFEGIDEIRPGNFVFYDLMQSEIGSCSTTQIAMSMACPIVAKHPDREELVVYGGGVHFSKDSTTVNGIENCFGLAVENTNQSWGSPIENVYLSRLSQEHGIVSAPKAFIEGKNIGDILYFLPIHSCMSISEMKAAYTLRGEAIDVMR